MDILHENVVYCEQTVSPSIPEEKQRFLLHSSSPGPIASELRKSSFIKARENLLRSHVNSAKGIWSWLGRGGRTSGPLYTSNVCMDWNSLKGSQAGRRVSSQLKVPPFSSERKSEQMLLGRLHKSALIPFFSFLQKI